MNRSGGYILLEALTALAVLSVSALAIHRATDTAILARAIARDYGEARLLLEGIEAECALQPRLSTGAWNEGAFLPPQDRFTWRWRVDPVELPPPDWPVTLDPAQRATLERGLQRHLGRLRIEIRWTRRGEPYQVDAETLLSAGRIWPPPESAAP